MSTSLFAISLVLLMVTSTLGHSQMRCAKYDMASGKCLAPIRNQAVAFIEENNDMTKGGGICQTPMMNPISASYANGAGCPSWAPCPDPMGSISQGENFTIMWIARNHAATDQTPGKIDLYLSPVESMDQGIDVSTAVFAQNKICEAPYMSCNGKNGDFVQCYATCKMPATAVVGVHTLWWKWNWVQGSGSTVYTTCADIYVTATSGSVIPTPTPSTPSTPVIPTPSAPTPVVPPTPPKVATTGMKPIIPSTTGMKPVVPSTTGRVVVPEPVTPTAPTTPVVPVPVTPTNPSTPQACILGSQVCIGSGQYQTCTNGREANYWADPQSCNAGTQCHPSTNPLSLNKIYCY